MGDKIAPNDMKLCHRVPVARNQKNINTVLQFVHRAKRSHAVENVRGEKLTCGDVGLHQDAP